MIVLLLLVVVMAVPVVAGFMKSRDQRRVDGHHFAAFVGFSAAIVAIVATIIGMIVTIVWFRPTEPRYYHPVQQGLVAAFGLIGLVSTGTAFLAGLFGNGIRRVALIVFGPAMVLIYVVSAFTNFGG